jgi:topoisomerase-4 subunit A
LEIVATDYRPVAELVFNKVKGVQKENQTVDLEAFIAVKGFKALGNQLTTDKLKQVNLLEPLPHEIPEEVVPEEIEVAGETSVDETEEDIQLDDDGQITLF